MERCSTWSTETVCHDLTCHDLRFKAEVEGPEMLSPNIYKLWETWFESLVCVWTNQLERHSSKVHCREFAHGMVRSEVHEQESKGSQESEVQVDTHWVQLVSFSEMRLPTERGQSVIVSCNLSSLANLSESWVCRVLVASIFMVTSCCGCQGRSITTHPRRVVLRP